MRSARVGTSTSEAELVAADARIGEVPGLDEGAVDARGAGEHDEGVLVVGSERQRRRAGPQVEVDAGVVGVASRGRGRPRELADQDGGDRAGRARPVAARRGARTPARRRGSVDGWATQSWTPWSSPR